MKKINASLRYGEINWEETRNTLLLSWLKKNIVDQIIGDMISWDNERYLQEYQWALSLWAEHLHDTKQRVIVTLDGRDTAGKWSNIKRVTDQLNHKNFWITAFGWIPTQEERFEDNWFQRFEASFPQDGKIQFYDRSWYNRAWVEAAMWFCTQQEYEWFMQNVNQFEKQRIIDKWIDYLKFYLSIGKDIQKERLQKRKSVRKRWKSSPVDAQAQEKWWQYTLAKERMLRETDSQHAPWIILDSTQRYESAVEIIKAIISIKDEVRKHVENDLSIDLSPNPKIRRSAQQELEKMEREWQIPSKKEFHFRNEAT